LKVRGKLAPRFIGPFKILEQKGDVTYQLKLPRQLWVIHDVFHVSQLKKFLQIPKNKSHWKTSLRVKILHIKSILSSYWRYPKELQGTKRFGCARFNGPTTQKKEPHGKEKKS
jgi:hypothetical protein